MSGPGVFGIDLGTTNLVVAVFGDGDLTPKPRVLVKVAQMATSLRRHGTAR
jgi:molecular chaperone DnaK (HSP70)